MSARASLLMLPWWARQISTVMRLVVRAFRRRARSLFARASLSQLVDRRGDPLREPAAIDEDHRRAMRADELEEPRVERGPDAWRRRAHGGGAVHSPDWVGGSPLGGRRERAEPRPGGRPSMSGKVVVGAADATAERARASARSAWRVPRPASRRAARSASARSRRRSAPAGAGPARPGRRSPRRRRAGARPLRAGAASRRGRCAAAV